MEKLNNIYFRHLKRENTVKLLKVLDRFFFQDVTRDLIDFDI